MNVTFTLTAETSGTTASTLFNISGKTSSNVVSELANGVTKSQLTTGYTINSVNDTITGGTIASTSPSPCVGVIVPWYVGTPPGTSVLLDNDFILGNTETSTCPTTGTPFTVYISQSDYDNRYVQGAVKFVTLYQDAALTTAWTGYSFVYVIGYQSILQEVFQINSSTGVIGNPTSAQPC